MSTPDFDIGIIGGGPAGSSMASYLAKAGVKCVLLERSLFPRPHVGESLVPSSTRVFKDIGFLETMEENNFPRKYGAAWTAANSKAYQHDFQGLPDDCRVDIRFEEREQPGVEQNYTYHVDRGKFDLLLLQHANKLGATVYEGVTVKSVDFTSGEFPRLHYSMGRKEIGLDVRMVVDASGRQTLLGNQLKMKVKDPVFDQFATHTWFEGFERGKSENSDFIFIHFLPMANTWIWQIPITESITSVGVVTQKKNFAKTKSSREEFFWNCIGTRPELLEKVERAKRIRPFTEEGDYSYALKQVCGDRFVMIGDAARFVDPIFSTGVSLALNGARLASRDIISAMETGDFSRESFSTYQTTIKRGMQNWYNFISLYYRLNILYTVFVNDPHYRLDVLKLLQGDVFDEDDPAVLREMRSIVSKVEQNENHIWHKLLGSLTANDYVPQ